MRLGAIVWHLALLGLCWALEPEASGPLKNLKNVDKVPNLVAAATGKLAAQVRSLLPGNAHVQLQDPELWRAPVPGAAVHTELGQAMGRLQKGLAGMSTSIAEWAKADEERIAATKASTVNEYRRQDEKAQRTRRLLNRYVNSLAQRKANFSKQYDALEVTERTLEEEVHKEQAKLNAARYPKKNLLRYLSNATVNEEKREAGSELHAAVAAVTAAAAKISGKAADKQQKAASPAKPVAAKDSSKASHSQQQAHDKGKAASRSASVAKKSSGQSVEVNKGKNLRMNTRPRANKKQKPTSLPAKPTAPKQSNKVRAAKQPVTVKQ